MQNLPKKVRSKKLNNRVDLTAMVSVSFLLIIFFMVVGELSKNKILDYSFYDEGCGPRQECNKPDENMVMTILLDGNNKVITYSGLLYNPIESPKELKYGKNGIREEILKKNNQVLQYSLSLGRYRKGVQIIIKPSKNSNYGNLVDILDEMKICNIKSYSIIEYYSPEESALLASN